METDRFIKAILAEPESDSPRLAFADWLASNGQAERAEYIRIECEQFVLCGGSTPNRWEFPRFWELENRRRALEVANAVSWFGRKFDKIEMETRRGFPWHIAVSVKQFIEHGEEYFRDGSTIQHVMLSKLGKNMPALANCAALANVQRLDFFETPFWKEQAEQIAASPYLGNLRSLDIGFTDSRIGTGGAAALAKAATLTRLEEIDLYSHAIYDQGAELLLKGLGTLVDVDFGNNGLTDWTAGAIYNDERHALRALNLQSNHLTTRGAGTLARAKSLSGLQKLTLSDNALGDGDGAALFAKAAFVSTLAALDLSRCKLDDLTVAKLLDAAWPKLAKLRLGGNAIGENAAAIFATGQGVRAVRELSLKSGGINAAIMRQIAAAEFSALYVLDVGHNPLGEAGVRALLDGAFLSPVRDLDLDATELGDAGAEAIAASPAISGVRWLKMRKNQIGDGGAVALAESPHLERVGSLDLSDNVMGEAGKAALVARFGKRVSV